MSTLYLIERHGQNDTNLPLSRVLDVQESSIGVVGPTTSGRFVVKVPDNIPVNNPTQLGPDQTLPVVVTGSLITQKTLGYLAAFSSFTRVVSDDLLTTTDIDFTNSMGVITGGRGSISLLAGGVLQSLGIPLYGSAPEQAYLTWDTYLNVDSDPAFPLYSRQYEELSSDPSNVTCQVSFNGGANFFAATDSTVMNILSGDRGTTFIIQLTNVSGSELSIGSWTLVF